ncbi:hypothetical protein Tco_0401064 [Tanacetum coccineum]
MAAEVPQTLEYKGGQLNVAPVLEVENFTNWKTGSSGVQKPEAQCTYNERKAANLDQRLKSLIMSVLPDDQMNSFISYEIAKSTWEYLILHHEGPSAVKENRVMDLKLCYNTFRFKEGENFTQTFTRYKALINELVNDGIKLFKLEINTGFINGLPKKWLSFCQSLRNANHVRDSNLASLFGKLKTFKTALMMKRIQEADEEEVSFDDNEMVKVKVLMALADDKSGDHVNAEIVKENQNLRKYLTELTNLTETWLNSSNKVNQCIGEEIPNQKKRILGIDQLTENPSSSRKKDPVFIKSSANDTKVSIPNVERPWLYEAEGFNLPNHDTGRILPS